MKTKQAIQQAAVYFASVENYYPSHCDCRCMLNDLIDYGHEYAQDHAVKRVQTVLKNASKLNCL